MRGFFYYITPNFMSFFFEYIYYRITKAYYKWDGDDGGTAIIGISMIQVVIILDFVLFLLRIFYDKSETSSLRNPLKWVFGILFVVAYFYNSRKHKNSYEKYKLYYSKETKKQKTLKGLLVIISMLLPWFIIYFII